MSDIGQYFMLQKRSGYAALAVWLRASTICDERFVRVASMSRLKPKNVSECRIGRIADASSMDSRSACSAASWGAVSFFASLFQQP
jgi:hypothetical protein